MYVYYSIGLLENLPWNIISESCTISGLIKSYLLKHLVLVYYVYALIIYALIIIEYCLE